MSQSLRAVMYRDQPCRRQPSFTPLKQLSLHRPDLAVDLVCKVGACRDELRVGPGEVNNAGGEGLQRAPRRPPRVTEPKSITWLAGNGNPAGGEVALITSLLGSNPDYSNVRKRRLK